jgi:hypothetical protein
VVTIAILLLSVLGSDLRAATFEVLCDGSAERLNRGCTIKLTGPIVKGDEERLRKTIRNSPSGHRYYRDLLLDSPGGDVDEALRIAKVVREALLNTSTSRSYPEDWQETQTAWACASSCFLVWVAGTYRSSITKIDTQFGPVGIGLHRPYFPPQMYENETPARIAEMQQNAAASVRNYLRREQIPETLIDKMLAKSSVDIYWLESDEERALWGMSMWFEELMIAKCQYNPRYYKEKLAEFYQKTDAIFEEARMQGKEASKEQLKLATDPNFVSWRKAFFECQNQVRADVQRRMRPVH